MAKIEYKIEVCNDQRNEEEKVLEAAGKEGWELVSVQYARTQTVFYFKK